MSFWQHTVISKDTIDNKYKFIVFDYDEEIIFYEKDHDYFPIITNKAFYSVLKNNEVYYQCDTGKHVFPDFDKLKDYEIRELDKKLCFGPDLNFAVDKNSLLSSVIGFNGRFLSIKNKLKFKSQVIYKIVKAMNNKKIDEHYYLFANTDNIVLHYANLLNEIGDYLKNRDKNLTIGDCTDLLVSQEYYCEYLKEQLDRRLCKARHICSYVEKNKFSSKINNEIIKELYSLIEDCIPYEDEKNHANFVEKYKYWTTFTDV